MRRLSRRLLSIGLSAGLAIGAGLSSAPARAWDPSTTHQGMLERAAYRSAMHTRWMDATELQRGLFSSVRVDPERLDDDERRALKLAIAFAHADSGSKPLGGPGSCPGAEAPPMTQRFCVPGERWELDAMGWMRLGIVAESAPSARIATHFLDRDDPSKATFDDSELGRVVLSYRQTRSNGSSRTLRSTRTAFDGSGPSALAWFEDEDDPLAPPALYRHLELASLAADPEAREHHLGMALLCTGALLHVVGDLSVPAHARGDVSAFFSPLSATPGDRGLPLQEYTRVLYGRHDLPGIPRGSDEPPSGKPVSHSIAGHVLGDSGFEGVATFARTRFFSESTVPAPIFIEDDEDAESAAQALLEGSDLDPVELEGAHLSQWPADAGYVLTGTGRPLAAFERANDGRIASFLDDVVYRDQARALLPMAIDAQRSLLDLLWPEPPSAAANGAAIEVSPPADLSAATAHLLVEDDSGRRRRVQKLSVKPGIRNRVVGLPTLEKGEVLIVVLIGERSAGVPHIVEKRLTRRAAPKAEPAPAPAPEPEPIETATESEPGIETESEPTEAATESEPEPEPAGTPPG